MQKQTLQQFPFNGYDLQNLKLLGQGSYGVVYKSKILASGREVAIKKINMQKINEENLLPALKTEISLMKQLKGPNIVQLIDSHIGAKYTYMILELCDTDLRKKMQKAQARFSQEECIKLFGGVMNGFKNFVQNSCIHRDIKPQNVLLKGQQVKIADFGFARKADMLAEDKYDQMCGTPIYMAPQILNNQPYTSKCDVWSLGLMLYEMVYGIPPWPIKCLQSYKNAINKRPLSFPYDVKCGKQTRDFIKKALTVDEQKRMGWEQVFSHPLIKDKISGQVCVTKPVQPKIRTILSKMQKQAQIKQVNQMQVFKKYSSLQKLNLQQFESLLKQLNPTITTYQINVLFQTCDNNNNGQIDHAQFEQMFCTVNYKTNPQIERQIDEIIGILKAKQIQLKQLFEKFDVNKSNALDSNQFRNLILSIAPKYSQEQLRKIYSKLDKNKSGLVDKKQFLDLFGGALATQNNYVGIWMQKAKRNLKMLKVHIQSKNLSPQQVMKMGDVNFDMQIDQGQFLKLMEKLGFQITKQQVDDVFKLIDTNKSGKISMMELMDYLK